MLARGFWLYVWKITASDGKEWFYVGRTGDSSSPHAQSPFARLSQHLGPNPRSNALRRSLKKRGVVVEDCRSLRLTAYGPILLEQRGMKRHKLPRDRIAGLEKGLCDALESAGYPLVNKVNSRKPIDGELFQRVLGAFASEFPKLRDQQ